jgi:hydrogenase assembly chaperone HypC/HupF
MCLAVPGRITALDGQQGKAMVRGNLINVEMGIVQANVGDYVLIHAGCAISLVPESEAREIEMLLDTVDEYGK